jgi:hypothetical protein
MDGEARLAMHHHEREKQKKGARTLCCVKRVSTVCKDQGRMCRGGGRTAMSVEKQSMHRYGNAWQGRLNWWG